METNLGYCSGKAIQKNQGFSVCLGVERSDSYFLTFYSLMYEQEGNKAAAFLFCCTSLSRLLDACSLVQHWRDAAAVTQVSWLQPCLFGHAAKSLGSYSGVRDAIWTQKYAWKLWSLLIGSPPASLTKGFFYHWLLGDPHGENLPRWAEGLSQCESCIVRYFAHTLKIAPNQVKMHTFLLYL